MADKDIETDPEAARELAETDDDHEWIPNPKQTGAIPGVTVTVTGPVRAPPGTVAVI
jgi:hypothetical protein